MSSGKPIIKASSNTQKYHKERERLNISRNNLDFELKKNYTTNLKQLIFLIDKLKKYSDNVTINGEQFSSKLIFQIIEVLLERQNRLEYIDTHYKEKINRLSSEDLQILNTPIGFIMHNTIEGGFEILNAMEDEMNTITNTDGITFTSTAKTNDERKNILNSWLDDLGRPNEKKKVTTKNNYYGGKKKKKRTKSLFKKKRTKRRRTKSLFKKKRTKRKSRRN